MNREIKFRFWLGHTKQMTHPHDLFEVGKIIAEYTPDIIALQYTGLKDKHGKEGYHKDILKGFGRLWVIEWQSEEARFLIMPYAGNISNWKFMDELHRMEIIGNIYENPELL